MTANKRNLTPNLNDDDAQEWADDVFDRAKLARGGKVVRKAEGTLTRRGRPPMGEATKQQVTLRLAPKVIDHFKATGAGWQTRVNSVLEQHVSGSLGGGGRSMFREVAEGFAMAKNEQTGKKAGTAASKVLRNKSTGKASKTAAGSALTQRPTKKK
ncbi:BrnA antitoxin family protein [Sphingomonas sp.]|uniref:BrnA antitoxin family protein n=1 Tax=Sphingomonas sp. TaxID=28214 RepID=UPI0025D26352|nr:BrnA antitoxin family protein [Sphingomonas sp.]